MEIIAAFLNISRGIHTRLSALGRMRGLPGQERLRCYAACIFGALRTSSGFLRKATRFGPSSPAKEVILFMPNRSRMLRSRSHCLETSRMRSPWGARHNIVAKTDGDMPLGGMLTSAGKSQNGRERVSPRTSWSRRRKSICSFRAGLTADNSDSD